MKVFGEFTCIWCNGTGNKAWKYPDHKILKCHCKNGKCRHLEYYREGNYCIEIFRTNPKSKKYRNMKWSIEICSLVEAEENYFFHEIREDGQKMVWQHHWELDIWDKDLKYAVKKALRIIRNFPS